MPEQPGANAWNDEPTLDLFARLAEPFHPEEIRIRPQGGREIQYITARMVMNRLDDVLGPGNWWDDYIPQENSVICRLTIRLPDLTTLTKCDAGGSAGMSDPGDDDKSAVSDAFKRAAVKFGVGRHLYRDGLPGFVCTKLNLTPQQVGFEPSRGGGRPPSSSPPPQRPQQQSPPPGRPQGQSPPPQNRGGGGGGGNAPTSGKGLFAWASELEKSGTPGVIKWISAYGNDQGLPDRMVQWTADQVRDCYEAWNGQ
jgi:hypothetical protein